MQIQYKCYITKYCWFWSFQCSNVVKFITFFYNAYTHEYISTYAYRAILVVQHCSAQCLVPINICIIAFSTTSSPINRVDGVEPKSNKRRLV